VKTMKISEWEELIRAIEREVSPETLKKVKRAFGEIFNASKVGDALRSTVPGDDQDTERLTFWYGEE